MLLFAYLSVVIFRAPFYRFMKNHPGFFQSGVMDEEAPLLIISASVFLLKKSNVSS